MVTLHIEHPITDFETWATAFHRFADARRTAGVRAHRVQRPVDDDHYLIISLDFDTAEAAAGFQKFLRTVVWVSPASAPGLAGEPRTLLLRATEL